MNRCAVICLVVLLAPAVSSCALGWEEEGDAQDALAEFSDSDSLDFSYGWLPDAPFDMPADAPVDTPASDCPASQIWCSGACESDCVPADEICNGIDEDCDTLCDDGFECCLGDGRGCFTSTAARSS
ncbi:MAG: hypothetical protein ABIJ56_02440 [Pseudomonadota bacterium]